MKRKGQVFLLAIFLCIGIYFAAESLTKTEYISQGVKSSGMASIWSKAIATSVNEKPINIYVDGNYTIVNRGNIYMDDTMNILVPIDVLTEAFDCSVNIYKKETLDIEKGNTILKMAIDEPKLSINGAEFRMASAPSIRAGIIYVPISAIVRGFGYTYSWDIVVNKATLINDNPSVITRPYAYNFIEKSKNTVVRNQGVRSTCWACAALTALETTLLPEEEYVFSIDHMTLNNSFHSGQFDGGDYTMALAYLAAWQGPVLEKDDPYGDRYTDKTLKPVVHVQEAQIIKAKNFEKIKEMVYKYGGVQSSLYTSMTNANGVSKFYNKDKYAYCYIGEEKPNHDIVIIGWDDNFPKENFNADIESDGAFVCQSSWGEEFGENGIFYVSYQDSNIGVHNIVYTGVENTKNYDRIYQSDLCGWQGILGYDQSFAYFANVFTSLSPEEVKAVGFYATDIDTKYNVYIVNRFEGVDSFNDMKMVASGTLKNAGYYTINLDNPVLVTGGKYAVVVRIDTPNSKKPVAVELATGYSTLSIDLSDGEGYLSLSGNKWINVEETYNCNLCLKAYTDEFKR